MCGSRIIPAPFSLVGNLNADINSTYSVTVIREIRMLKVSSRAASAAIFVFAYHPRRRRALEHVDRGPVGVQNVYRDQNATRIY